MKFEVFCVIFFLSYTAAMNLSSMLRQSISEVVQNCEKSSGASVVDMQILRQKKLPTTQTGLCMLQCVFTKANIMKDGNFNKDAMLVAATPLLKGDLSKLGKLIEFGGICEKEIGKGSSEKCRNVKLLVECANKYGKQYGFDVPITV